MDNEIEHKGNCYIVKIGKKYVSSPTDQLTNNKEFAACIETKEQAEWLLKHHTKKF